MREYQVYRSYAGGAVAIDSAALLGRRGLLTLGEARQVASQHPEAWIGTYDGVRIVCVQISDTVRKALRGCAS